MAKAKTDIILRDRLQFTLGGDSDLSLVYGRIDLSDYVNVVKRTGLLVKDVYLQIRDPTNANTGTWSILQSDMETLPGVDGWNAYKLFVSARAYESAADVGIASPDVLHVEDYIISRYTATGNTVVQGETHRIYPMRDYHPGGYPVVSDLLVGIAVDTNATDTEQDDATLEVDIMLIAETTTVTSEQMTQLLTQAQDL